MAKVRPVKEPGVYPPKEAAQRMAIALKEALRTPPQAHGDEPEKAAKPLKSKRAPKK